MAASLEAQFRDYYLIGTKRFSTFTTVGGFFLLLDDGVSKLLLDDGASFLITRPGDTIESYVLEGSSRDYALIVQNRD